LEGKTRLGEVFSDHFPEKSFLKKVIPEYFPQGNIPNENVDILLLFSYIQLTPNKFSLQEINCGGYCQD